MRKLISRLYYLLFKCGTSCRNLKVVKREFRLYRQRLQRGWDDSDTWGLDSTIAAFITPRLKRFKELNNGLPGENTEEGYVTLTEERWDAILDKMIFAFEIIAKNDLDDQAQYAREIEEGLALFAKWYCHLWW